jgi:hypothetical protein
MGDASAESKLAALIQGATRDQARMLRIAELESLPKAKMAAVAMDLKPRVVQEDTP